MATSTPATGQAGGKPDRQAVRTMLRHQIESLPFVSAIWTLDVQGRIEFSSDEGDMALDLSESDYFTAQRTRPGHF